ncbi:flagellar hook-associated protein FlgL [Rheinheimera texasensis]|uniref:flagellar hook-associated protein FlgL n=1 Tax=Rheinheimera texasensis TaxID=306205 RepID=UPI0032B2DFAB
MRLSFNQKYQINLNAILNAQEKLQNASAKLEKQTKILSPSDDPAGSARVVALDQQISQVSQYQNNSILLKNSLSIEETVLGSLRTSSDQARSLIVSLGNGTYSQQDRSAIAKQLDNIKNQMFDLMNQKDANGGYLFSGFQQETQPYSLNQATGLYEYKGDEGQKALQVSPTVTIPSNDSGKVLFEDVNARYQTTTPTVAGGLTSGSINVQNQSVFDDFYRQNYDAQTAANNNYRLVVDAANNYEIRRNGASLTPPVTGAYTSGQAVNFQGLSLQTQGAGPGQLDFTLQAPEKKNILNTLQDLINSIETYQVFGRPLNDAIADALVQLDNAALKIDAGVSGVGGRQNVLDSVFEGNEDLQITNKAFRAQIYEVDYAEALTELTKQETALQAVQNTFQRVTNTSLFDYIR